MSMREERVWEESITIPYKTVINWKGDRTVGQRLIDVAAVKARIPAQYRDRWQGGVKIGQDGFLVQLYVLARDCDEAGDDDVADKEAQERLREALAEIVATVRMAQPATSTRTVCPTHLDHVIEPSEGGAFHCGAHTFSRDFADGFWQGVLWARHYVYGRVIRKEPCGLRW